MNVCWYVMVAGLEWWFDVVLFVGVFGWFDSDS